MQHGLFLLPNMQEQGGAGRDQVSALGIFHVL